MRETRTAEFKETVTNTFLKTVSAFSNYDGGEIFFGIDDDGNIKGLPDVKQACLDIENKVNDSITPQPDYTLELQNNDRTVKLTVKSGYQKPYLYKSKAYKRNNQDTLKTLNLYSSTMGYNNAAGILADQNHFPGIDLVKFGENISEIMPYVEFGKSKTMQLLKGMEKKGLVKIEGRGRGTKYMLS